MTDFISLVKKSRSIRIFDNSKPISEEQLKNIISAVRYAPSSANLQVLKFRIVSRKDEVSEVRKFTKWAGLLQNYSGPDANESPSAYIVICADTCIVANADTFDKDVGIAAQTMALYACEAGIGSCMIGAFDKTQIPVLLNLSDNLVPKLILALGYPLQNTIIEDAEDSVKYYRDENGNHHVPKRKLEDIIIEK